MLGATRWAGIAVALVVALAPAALPATATATTTPALPVAWRATSAAALNEPALTPNGVATTAGNVATERGLAHGGVLWNKVLPNQGGYNPTLGAPTVQGSVAYVVFAVTPGDGTVDYATSNGAATVNGPMPHELLGQLIVNGASSARLAALDTGSELIYALEYAGETWYLSSEGGGPLQPALVGSRAFVPIGNGVDGVDPAQGCNAPPQDPQLCFTTWQATTPGQAQTPSAAGTGRIATSDTSGVVTAFNVTTGAVLWATPSFGTSLGPTASSGNIVYAGGADGVLRALNATSGALVWKGSAGAPIRTPPTISGGHVYVATDNGRLVAFNTSGCGKATCTPTAIGNAALPNTLAAGAPLIRNTTAVVAYGTHLIAFTV